MCVTLNESYFFLQIQILFLFREANISIKKFRRIHSFYALRPNTKYFSYIAYINLLRMLWSYCFLVITNVLIERTNIYLVNNFYLSFICRNICLRMTQFDMRQKSKCKKNIRYRNRNDQSLFVFFLI